MLQVSNGENQSPGNWFPQYCGVNSKKPPHYSVKFKKPPLFVEIAKIHRYCENLLQCALVVDFNRVKKISDELSRLRGTTVIVGTTNADKSNI
jgi:hypothetical protein